MRNHNKILIWENERRLNKLVEFHQLVIEYFNNIDVEWISDRRIENQAAQMARTKINQAIPEAHSIIHHSGINPNLTVIPAPAVGGRVTTVNLIHNIFILDKFYMGEEADRECNDILDIIERVIGIYKSNHKSALIRTFNPFFYLGWLFDIISDLPFIAIGKFGFNQQKAKMSVMGRLVKGILYLITVLAAFLTILYLLDFLGPFKQFVHKLLGYNKAN